VKDCDDVNVELWLKIKVAVVLFLLAFLFGLAASSWMQKSFALPKAITSSFLSHRDVWHG
jgi:hypothetical protein